MIDTIAGALTNIDWAYERTTKFNDSRSCGAKYVLDGTTAIARPDSVAVQQFQNFF